MKTRALINDFILHLADQSGSFVSIYELGMASHIKTFLKQKILFNSEQESRA